MLIMPNGRGLFHQQPRSMPADQQQEEAAEAVEEHPRPLKMSSSPLSYDAGGAAAVCCGSAPCSGSGTGTRCLR